MGDTSNLTENHESTAPSDPEVTKCDEPKASIDVLRESKPSENIAIVDPEIKVSSTVHTVYRTEIDPKESPLHSQQSDSSQDQQKQKDSKSSIEGESEVSASSLTNADQHTPRSSQESAVISEKQSDSNKDISANQSNTTNQSLEKKQANTDITDASEPETATPRGDSNIKLDDKVASSFSMPAETTDKAPYKKSSDIFIAKDVDCISTTIFSVSGAPSRKIFKKRDTPSTIFPVGCMGCKEDPPSDKINQKSSETSDKLRPSSSTSLNRNPLTGFGVEAKDEYKMKTILRKDGNPVLGLGYDQPTASPSNSRIPPGGYSKGLW